MKSVLGTVLGIVLAGPLSVGAHAQNQSADQCHDETVATAHKSKEMLDRDGGYVDAAEQLAKENTAAIKKLQSIAKSAQELRLPDLQLALEQVDSEIDRVRTRLNWLTACSATKLGQETKEK